MNRPDLEGLFVVLTIAIGVVAWLLYCASLWVVARLSDRHQERARLVGARLAQGLPPHERCFCLDCAEWRAVPANVTRLQG